VKLITPSEYLAEYSVNQMALPSASSWGWKGYNEFWLEGSNDWLYRHLHMAGKRMVELVEKYPDYAEQYPKRALIRRALNQAARELVLAQSSDWAFIMKTGTMVPYAQKRTRLHLGRFTRLYDDVMNGTIDGDWLKEVEWRDNIFHDMECAAYYSAKPTTTATNYKVFIESKTKPKSLMPDIKRRPRATKARKVPALVS
jgi:1,4-alpha-glucan branching enzyme